MKNFIFYAVQDPKDASEFKANIVIFSYSLQKNLNLIEDVYTRKLVPKFIALFCISATGYLLIDILFKSNCSQVLCKNLQGNTCRHSGATF